MNMGELEESKRVKPEEFPATKEAPIESKAPNHVSFRKTVVTIPDEKIIPPKPLPVAQSTSLPLVLSAFLYFRTLIVGLYQIVEILGSVTEAADHGIEKSVGDVNDRDAALARVELEKRLALIKAWEDSEKTKSDNKAYKKISSVESWENAKRASVEAQIKQIEEEFEKKKAEYREKMKNKIAEIHKAAEEKRAMIEAKKKEDFLKVEETAAKFRSTNTTPNKLLIGCFN